MPHWRDNPIYVIDFEGSPSTGVIEYGVVTLLGEEIQATDTRLCQPLADLSLEDTRLHGIKQSEAAGHAPFADEWERFREYRSRGGMAAHHASVEHGFLKRQWSYPPKSPDWLGGGDIADWGPWVDTRRLYEVVYPQLESYQLGELITRFALQSELDETAGRHCPDKRRKAHCALYDALASALLLIRLCREEGFEDTTLAWLVEQSLPSQAKKQAARQGDLFE